MESNETNNIAYKAITIGANTKPDLVINSISAISGTSGSSLNFTYKIKNEGSATANSSKTGFYLSTDTALDIAFPTLLRYKIICVHLRPSSSIGG